MSNVTGNTMHMAHFHDFYYLEALTAGMSMAKSARPELAFKHSFVRLESDVAQEFSRVTKSMALRIYVYLWAAACGEARHADSYCNNHVKEFRHSTRSTVYEKAMEVMPVDGNLEVIKTIYTQKWQSSSFGGRKWNEIVEGMMMFGNVPDAAFIDHAVDLEHNGGCVFTKDAEDTTNLQCFGEFGYEGLKPFLDYKFAHDILNKIPGYVYRKHENGLPVSRKVFSLVTRYHNVVKNVLAVEYLSPELETLSDYTVEWGNDTIELAYGKSSRYEEREERRDNEDYTHCANCGDKVHLDDAIYSDVAEEDYCSSCYVDKFAYCEKCGHEDHKDNFIDASHHHKYYWLCEDCASEEMYKCEDCDEWHENVAITEDNGEFYCEDCQDEYKCDECGQFYSDLDWHKTHEHYTPSELTVDGDGVFEVTQLAGDLYPYKQVTKTLQFGGYNKHEETHKCWTFTGTPLVLFHNEPKNKTKWHMMTPCGLYANINADSFENAIDKMTRIGKLFDWNTIRTTDDWSNCEHKNEVLEIISEAK